MNRSIASVVAVLTMAATVTAVAGGAPGASAGPATDPATAIAASLRLGSQEHLAVRHVITDADGTRHVRYDRSYAGLRVIGGDLIVHQATSGAVRAVDRAGPATINLTGTTPKVTAATATGRAGAAHRELTGQRAVAQLVVWAAAGTPVLAWDTVLTGVRPDQTPSRLHVVSDAATGAPLSTWDDIKTGTGNSMYAGTVTLDTTVSGSTFQLRDATRGNQQTSDLNGATSGNGTLFTDADDVWGDGTVGSRQTAGVDAQYGAAQTWDYYRDVHGRNGIRDDGVGASSRVHYGNNYVNAFWDDSCFCMTYGDGSGNTHPLTALDVAGHEMSHGVTSSTADLIYAGESGGLNEATSDIFGTAVEFNAASGTDVGDYLIGEKIDINGNGTPLRYMDQPSKDGHSRDCWSTLLRLLNVHYSSGPANHFFFLLSEGSGARTVNGVAYNSPTCNGSTVTGIGRAKAEQIWYRALTVYMTSSTNYSRARAATLNAASDLYGASSAERTAVANAWSAVSVN